MQNALVEGVSMWPTLRKGYLVQFKTVDLERLEPGDILVLKGRGRRGEVRWKVHRFLGRVGPYFLEAGDNAFSCSLVEPKDILGKVTEARDWDGKRVRLENPRALSGRFRFFRASAEAFLLAHETKNRLLGNRKSYLLWKASELYRGVLHVAGLKVPVIPPA